MARRASHALGRPVRIEALRYELLASRFVGRGIAVGPDRTPLVRIPRLVVKLALFSGQRWGAIERIVAQGPTARVSGLPDKVHRWPSQAVSVKSALIKQAELVIGKGKNKLFLSGLRIELTGFSLVPLAGGGVRLAGAVHLRAARVKARVRWGTVEPSLQPLGALELKGHLEDNRLVVERLTLEGEAGRLALEGTIQVTGRAIGPVKLTGTMRWGQGARDRLKGTVRLSGPTLSRALVSLRLTAAKGAARGRWGIGGLPPLEVRGKVGRSRVTGTLRSLRIR